MLSDIHYICDKEISRLSKNVRIILNKPNISDNDLDDLNRYYDDLDFYNYHKNYNYYKRLITEGYDDEQE